MTILNLSIDCHYALCRCGCFAECCSAITNIA
jgi:hypothetical protein